MFLSFPFPGDFLEQLGATQKISLDFNDSAAAFCFQRKRIKEAAAA